MMSCKKYRGAAIFLTVALLLPALASCATGTEDETTVSSTAVAVTEEEKETAISDDLPHDLYYGGDEIIIISDKEMDFEALTGDAVNDALYERNRAVEERLGVKLTCIEEDNVIDKIIASISSGSADYDVVEELCWRTAPKFTSGYFRDLRQTDYLDFEKIYWNQSFNDVVSYNGAQYGITGAMMLSLYRRTYVTVFNKELFTNANQTFLYEYVENNTWTLDKQAALVPLFHRDNGNNKQDMTEDIFGFVSNDFIYVDPYWASCEVEIIRKNASGEYEWVFEPGKLYDMAEKVLALYYATDNGSYIEHDDYQAEQTVIKVFSGGNAAMATLCIEALELGEIRNMEAEYGVVPIPKYSEEQVSYRSQMHDGFTIACIPTTVPEERTHELSAVLEAMCSISYRVVRPVYYETTLRTKLAKDPQSAAMMDLIIDHIFIDPGFVYSHSMGSFHQGFQQLVDKGQNDAISRYKRMSTSAQRAFGRFLEQLDKLSG